MNIIDISLPLSSDLPVYPGLKPFNFERARSFQEGHNVNVTNLEFAAHVGTHLDTPSHFLPDGSTIEQVDLNRLIGPAQVVELEAACIEPAHLQAAGIQRQRVLIKTSLSKKAKLTTFDKDAPYLHPSAASWLVEHDVQLVGIDGWTPDRYGDHSHACHHILLGAGVLILEYLNLRSAGTGFYSLVALPLNVVGSEASPVRAVLLPDSTT